MLVRMVRTSAGVGDGAAVAGPVGLDDQRGRACGERGRLAGAAEDLDVAGRAGLVVAAAGVLRVAAGQQPVEHRDQPRSPGASRSCTRLVWAIPPEDRPETWSLVYLPFDSGKP